MQTEAVNALLSARLLDNMKKQEALTKTGDGLVQRFRLAGEPSSEEAKNQAVEIAQELSNKNTAVLFDATVLQGDQVDRATLEGIKRAEHMIKLLQKTMKN